MSTFALNQIQVFLIFIFCGVLIGFLFDIFRILRKSFKTPDTITYIEDIIFWLLTCLLLAYTIFRYNNGEIRFYIFVGIFIGSMLYMLLISKYIVNISVKIICIIKKIISKLVEIVLYPLKAVLIALRKLFFKPISFIFINISKTISRKINKICKNNVKKIHHEKDFS